MQGLFQSERRSGAIACAVWIDFLPASIIYRPYLLPLDGRPCVGRVLERLREAFMESVEYDLVCPPHSPLDTLEREADRNGARLFVATAESFSDILAEFSAARPGRELTAFFDSGAALFDPAVASRLIAIHLAEKPAITVAADLPPGLAPALVIGGRPEDMAMACATRAAALADTPAMVRRTAADQAGAQRVRLVDRSSLGLQDLPDGLPASLLVEDEPGRVAAEAVLRCGAVSPARVGSEFRRAKNAFLERPRPARRTARRAEGTHTILFSSIRTPFAGAENSLLALINGLHRSEFRAVAVFPFATMLAEEVERCGLDIEIAGWDYSQLSAPNLAYCGQLLDQYRPDAVHVDLLPNPALMVACHTRGIPLIGHMRTMARGTLPAMMDLFEKIIVVSDAVGRNARQNGVAPEKLVTIHNGVDVSLFRRPHAGVPELRHGRSIPCDARVITSVGLAPFKRVDLLLAAMPMILNAVPDAHFVLAGETCAHDADHHARLRKLVDESGHRERVTWCGFERRMEELYALSDVLVLCHGQEALCRSMIEGMAFGLPLVGPDDGGSPELITHGVNGLLFAPGSYTDLGDALVRILSDDGLRQTMREAAALKVQQFTAARYVGKVQALYRDVIQCAARQTSVAHS